MAYISLVMANKIMSIRMSIHTSVHMLHMPTCAHTCAYTHAYTYVCMHVCMHFYTHVGTQVYTYVHTHAYTHVCTHVCTCMSIHMSIYTYLSPSRPLVFMRPNACPHAMPARMPRKISGTRLRTHVCTCTCRGMFMCMSVHMAAHTCRGAWPMPPSPPGPAQMRAPGNACGRRRRVWLDARKRWAGGVPASAAVGRGKKRARAGHQRGPAVLLPPAQARRTAMNQL